MSTELQRADEDARLIAEAAALGALDPSVWDAYMEGWVADVKRRINAKFTQGELPGGIDGTTGGAVGGVGPSEISGTGSSEPLSVVSPQSGE